MDIRRREKRAAVRQIRSKADYERYRDGLMLTPEQKNIMDMVFLHGHTYNMIGDALGYLDCAAKAKDEGRTEDYSDYIRLATAEFEHPPILHRVAVRAIERWRGEHPNVSIPAYMEAKWDEEHKWYMDKMAELRYKAELVRG